MKYSVNCCVLFFLAVLFVMFWCTERESFGSGALVQLQTSRPYYGWYDYFQRDRGPYWDWNYGWWQPSWNWQWRRPYRRGWRQGW